MASISVVFLIAAVPVAFGQPFTPWNLYFTPNISYPAVQAINTPQRFDFTYTHATDASELTKVEALINGELDGRVACLFNYRTFSNSFLPDTVILVADNGSDYTQMESPAPGGTLSDSQCTVSFVSATQSSNTLVLSVDITFRSPFSGTNSFGQDTGQKAVYMAASAVRAGSCD